LPSYFDVKTAEVGVINLSSSDIEEALDVLSLSPTCGSCSQPSNLHSCSDSDFFKDWTEANDMRVSVYVALTGHASSARASTIIAACDR
jgi:hypothetical protein